ncbi:phage minor head protein [uncultured Bilophila sp.]|uniref:phage minor head protein n=1 Tax=uncultured Bilophila sp. TaxID=529385 RepID=UPI0026DC2009|nr:phage minor head protein [uncultured Bilophila sp.]
MADRKKPVSLQEAFRLPPEEAVAYFESKGYKISFDWRQVWQEEHDKVFTVAGVARDDVLFDIRSHLSTALKEGWSQKRFMDTLTPRLKEKGWWGSEVIVDEDGTSRVYQKGSASRLDLIFRQNVQTAYAAGRWQRQQEAKKERPYLRYSAILDGRTRPAHRALDGKTFPVDDPFWRVFYPPNGFRCRCTVVSLSRREVDPDDVSHGDGNMVERDVELRPDRDTGEARTVKVGGYMLDGKPGGRVVYVDPGFSRNPGEGWELWDEARALPDVPPGVGGKTSSRTNILPGQLTFTDYGLLKTKEIPKEELRPSPERLPEAKTREEAVERLATALQLEGDRARQVETPVGPVMLQRDLVKHMVQKEEAMRERYAAFVLPALEHPDEVWLTAYADGYRKRYVAFFREENMLLIVRVNRDGSLFWNGIKMRDKDIDKQRTGILLYQDKKEAGQ